MTAQPQPVLHPYATAAVFLTLTIEEGGQDAVRTALPDFAALYRSVGFSLPHQTLSLVVGFGSDGWDRLFAGPRPDQLHPFVRLDGGAHVAPSTPGDVLLHIRASSMDACFTLGKRILDELGDAVAVVDEVHGFVRSQQRDLLGFVDGTENPQGPAATTAALVATGPFAGGSYVTVQKYLHDLGAWEALSIPEQEAVIGRHKDTDIEIPNGVKPLDSHVARNSLDDRPDGTPREILRENMPFGELGTGEFGTLFIGYAADLDITEEMLRRMFLGGDGATHDTILDFSTAHTGNVFFCPPQPFLDNPPAGPVVAAPTAPPAPVPDPSGDDSLGIGDPRRSN